MWDGGCDYLDSARELMSKGNIIAALNFLTIPRQSVSYLSAVDSPSSATAGLSGIRNRQAFVRPFLLSNLLTPLQVRWNRVGYT